MENRQDTLDIIISEFPESGNKIKELYHESTSFLEICEDYVICLESIKKFATGFSALAESEVKELKRALFELKEELLSRII